MNLAIDYGNSRIKVGLFDETNLADHFSFESEEKFGSWTNGKSFEHVIVCSVAQSPNAVLEKVNTSGLKLTLTPTIALPIKIQYKTPKTLGVDRIAAACGALDVMSGQDRLVLDLGTCINYEFVDRESNYYGGAISPGVSMRFQAMHTFTAKLPLVKSKNDAPLTGDSTESCMQSGVMNGVLAELNGIMTSYREIYPQLGVILCGGDAILFENKLKQPIFVAPNLVLSGLNRILLHNVNF